MSTRYRRPDDVAVIVDLAPDAQTVEVVYLAHLPSGSLVVLEGTGALIWSWALADGDPGDIVARLARGAGVDPDDIRDDIDLFLRELVGRGLLETA